MRNQQFWDGGAGEALDAADVNRVKESLKKYADTPFLHSDIPKILSELRVMGLSHFTKTVLPGDQDTPLLVYTEFFELSNDVLDKEFMCVLARHYGHVMTLAEEILHNSELLGDSSEAERARTIIPFAALRPFLQNFNSNAEMTNFILQRGHDQEQGQGAKFDKRKDDKGKEVVERNNERQMIGDEVSLGLMWDKTFEWMDI